MVEYIEKSLAGLFHDIATPCFSHCIDFLNKDYLKQESTELETQNIIKNSKKIAENFLFVTIHSCDI